MEESKLTEEQQRSKDEAMLRAVAFESLTHNEGFAYLQAYYENKLKTFVNDIFNKETKPLSDFEDERHELLGLKKMFGEIEFGLQQLENDRKNNKPTE